MTALTTLVRAAEVSAPVARCAQAGDCDGDGAAAGRTGADRGVLTDTVLIDTVLTDTVLTGTVVGVFTHSVSLRCDNRHGVPLLINLSEAPVESVCQARIAGDLLTVLRRDGIGAPVALDTARAAVVPTRLTASGRPVPFTPPPSWFDTGDGLRLGRPRLERAAAAIVADEVPAPLEALCGLGIGLTPSGDDALVGLMVAARTAGVGNRVIRRFAALLADPRAADLTTETSLCHLRLAAGGDFSPTVLDLLAALTGGRGEDPRSLPAQRRDIETAVTRLARVGHSSGADLMAGVSALADRLADGLAPADRLADGPAPADPPADGPAPAAVSASSEHEGEQR